MTDLPQTTSRELFYIKKAALPYIDAARKALQRGEGGIAEAKRNIEVGAQFLTPVAKL
ncbi:MAG: hypothetical protein WCD70_06715 [Alphaproteobacteria bacterium]